MTKKSTNKKGSKYISLDKKESSLIALAFIVIGIILYGSTIGFDYVLDDAIVITDNNYVKEGISGIGNILTTDSLSLIHI